jgi:hypothetical protein
MLDLIVKEIEPGDGMERHLTYVDYAPQIFTLTDSVEAPAWNPIVGEDIGSSDAPPGVPEFGEIYSSALSPQSGDSTLYVPLSPGGGGVTTYYGLQHRLQGETDWTEIEFGANPGSTIITTYLADDIVEMRAGAGGPGGESDWSDIVTHTIGATDPGPSGLTSFSAAQLDATTWRFTFATAPAGGDVLIKYRVGHWTTWANLTSQLDAQSSSPHDSTTPTITSATEYSFGARLIDSSGVESGTPIIVQVTTA